VSPPRSVPVSVEVGDRPARALYAVVRSICAWLAAAFLLLMVPGGVTLPGGKPVIEVPGETPTSPSMTLKPVLVTAEPASTAKGVALPRVMVSAWAIGADTEKPNARTDKEKIDSFIFLLPQFLRLKHSSRGDSFRGAVRY